MNGEPLMLVHTMGRVGSSAVHAALTEHGETYHLHYLNPASLAKWADRRDVAPRNVRDSFTALDRLADESRPVLLVTLVRDAMERNLSAAFTAWRQATSDHSADSMAAAWAGFYDRTPFRWFDDQVRDALGVDVYAEPFTGTTAFTSGRFRVVVLRSDLENARKSELLSREVGRPVRVGTENVGNRGSEYVDLYARFVETVPLTGDYLRDVAESRFMRHFFAPNQDAYVERWLGQRVP